MSELMKSRGDVSRRQFLRLSASSLGTLAVLSAQAPAALASDEGNSAQIAAVLLDVSRCTGCQSCQRACIQANDLHPNREQLRGLSAQTYTFVDRRQSSDGQTRWVQRQCMHCLHPGCVSACTVGALARRPNGAVVADARKCIGCRYCQYACPFGVPQFEWENTLGVIRKCTSCIERLEQGQVPACTAACPSGALKFGQRGDLLHEAHARLAAHPEHYVDHVYGENEVGGTARLYLSDVSFEQLGLPELGSQPASHYAEQVMTRTPTIAISVAAVCTGIYSFLRWRQHDASPSSTVQAEEQRQ